MFATRVPALGGWSSMQFWDELVGSTVAEKYPLRKLLRTEGRSAWFETEDDGDPPRIATIQLTQSLNDQSLIVDRLETARGLAHPNLIQIGKIGTAVLKRESLVFSVMEMADMNLGEVLRDHPLEEGEVSDLARTLTKTLTFIHEQGFVHGRVEASSVLAVGETIKLRSDCLQKLQAVEERPDAGDPIAADVQGIGNVLFQSLTQRLPKSGSDSELQRLPAPFAQIIRNTLSGRWTLRDVDAALNGKPGAAAYEAPAPAIAAAEAPVAETISSPGPAEALPDKTLPLDQPSDPGARARKRLVFAAAAVAILLVIILLNRHSAHSALNPAPVSANSEPASAPVAPAQEAAPTTPAPAPPAVQPPLAENESTSGHKIWRVVAFTYNREGEAQHKAQQVEQHYPQLQVAVFSPKESRTRYLVVLGGQMTREEAIQLREKAIREGLPRDTYAQNFSE